MPIHVEKKGIRALGIAESFRKGSGSKSILAGVVMRSDLIIDGFIFGASTIGGDDATESIIQMFKTLDRNDINVILLGGAVISLYNIIDVDRLGVETETPVISITFEESEGLEPHIKHHFPKSWRRKLTAYKKLGVRKELKLKTGYKVFVRNYGLTELQARRTLDKFTLQGALPEPIRLAKLLARAKLDSEDRTNTGARSPKDE